MRGVTPTYLLLYSSLCLPQRVLHPLTNGCYTNLPTAATNAPSLSVFLNGCYTNLPTVVTNTPCPSLYVSLNGCYTHLPTVIPLLSPSSSTGVTPTYLLQSLIVIPLALLSTSPSMGVTPIYLLQCLTPLLSLSPSTGVTPIYQL